MSSNMIIKETNLNLIYPKISDYRKKFVASEDILNDNFQPPIILPIMDEIPENIPRIVLKSKNNHSTLSIGLSVASFTTMYDDTFSNDWKKCKDYLENRTQNIYQLIDNMTNNGNIFTGLITNIIFDNLDISGLDTLKHSLLNNTSKLGNLYDILCKFTYVYQNKYYINITLNNQRDNELIINNGRTFIKDEKRDNIIVVSIDVNDRYKANSDPNYVSSQEELIEILNITTNIINHKLFSLIEKGVFNYE